jgi:TPR repeat protein
MTQEAPETSTATNPDFSITDVMRDIILGRMSHDAGLLEEIGILFEKKEAKKDKEAIAILERHAEKQNPWAQYYLGFCLLYGVGISQDTKKAIALFHAAAVEGNAKAQAMLGLHYSTGQAQDPKEAKNWLELAVDQENQEAESGLNLLWWLDDGSLFPEPPKIEPTEAKAPAPVSKPAPPQEHGPKKGASTQPKLVSRASSSNFFGEPSHPSKRSTSTKKEVKDTGTEKRKKTRQPANSPRSTFS